MITEKGHNYLWPIYTHINQAGHEMSYLQSDENHNVPQHHP